MAARALPRRTLLYPDVVPVLTTLKGRGFRLAAVTNGYLFYQEPLLRALGLCELLDVIIGPERVGTAKPDPRLWTEGLRGETIVAHVGDRLWDDVAGARAAGVFAIWLNRSGRPPRRWPAEPDCEVDSLWPLLALDRLAKADRASAANPSATRVHQPKRQS